MSKVFTTEITSESIPSDNPVHQRLLKAYVVAEGYVKGDLLEVGCGEGRGIERLMPLVSSYSAIDKIESALVKLRQRYPSGQFISGNIPPLKPYSDNSFDFVVTFQVIEHIESDLLFLKEIHRVLKPGGQLLLTTPNRPLSLTRNPWHVREYTAAELTNLARQVFHQVEMKGITGNEKVMEYYERNKKSVKRLTRFDIFNLQHKLPASVLRVPYELMNRWNRDRLSEASDELVRSISHTDYVVTDRADSALDLFLLCRK
jgi:ubiquinone/menaquinone biosynthesis C-methylase UbiE